MRDWVQDKYPKTKVNVMERQEDHDGTNFPQRVLSTICRRRLPRHRHRRGVWAVRAAGPPIQAILMDEMARNLAGSDLGLGDLVVQRQVDPEVRHARRSATSWSRQMVAGEKMVAIAITEPGGGTDLLGAMITRAKPADGGFTHQRRQDLVDDGSRVRLPAAAGQDLRRREVLARQDAVPRAHRSGGRRRDPDPQARDALRGLLRGPAR